MQQLPVDDGTGFLVKPLVCRKLSAPTSATQYLLVDGSRTRDRDNVWAECTVCKMDEEYQASGCQPEADAVCRPVTQCDPRYQYVKRRANFQNDNVCELKTMCNAFTERGMYEKFPAVDSPNFYQNGTDAVCANYSLCPSGHYRSFPGNDTHDVSCSRCPPGTYRNATLDPDRQSCTECPVGTYASAAGSASCTPCTNCLLPDSPILDPSLQQCPFSPAWKHCVRAARAPCTATSDAECMVCPALSFEGGFAIRDGSVCHACRDGYFYNESEPVLGRRCIPCPAGFYCPSRESIVECEGLQVFASSSSPQQRFVVPTSEPASASSAACNCSVAGGGFEPAPGSQGLFGCQPCEDGHYRTPSMPACEPCPAGTYAAQRRGLNDYRLCLFASAPATSSSLGLLVATHGWPYVHSTVMTDAACQGVPGSGAGTATAGATSCTACPPDRPHTWGVGSTSVADCRRCPPGQFFSEAHGGCRQCSEECKPPYMYESSPCTETSDRTCSFCDFQSCNRLTEYVDAGRGCPGAIDPGRPCSPCTNKPNHSVYVFPSETAILAGESCTWACAEGYFLPPGSSECQRCSPLSASECTPGHILAPCSPSTNTDASCDQLCDPQALGKPSDETSEWVWTTYSDADALAIVHNPTGGTDGRPNVGCMWRCRQGFTLRQLDLLGAGGGGGAGGEGSKVSLCV